MSSTASFHDLHGQAKKAFINGRRPSPLTINKAFHLIQKPSSLSSVVPETKQHKPIIIYDLSPEVIHTGPRDFMALVQRLTGNGKAQTGDEVSANKNPKIDASGSLKSSLSDVNISTDASSVLRFDNDETCGGRSRTVNAQLISPSGNMGFVDMPLFTPNSADLFCSSQSAYKFSDSPFGNFGSFISPTGLEFIKQLPEY